MERAAVRDVTVGGWVMDLWRRSGRLVMGARAPGGFLFCIS